MSIIFHGIKKTVTRNKQNEGRCFIWIIILKIQVGNWQGRNQGRDTEVTSWNFHKNWACSTCDNILCQPSQLHRVLDLVAIPNPEKARDDRGKQRLPSQKNETSSRTRLSKSRPVEEQVQDTYYVRGNYSKQKSAFKGKNSLNFLKSILCSGEF